MLRECIFLIKFQRVPESLNSMGFTFDIVSILIEFQGKRMEGFIKNFFVSSFFLNTIDKQAQLRFQR